MKDLLTLCDFPITKKWNLIYRASRDGLKASDFHLHCDNKPNTLILIKSENGNVFGSYTEQSWSDNDTWKADDNSFIFSLINKDNKPLKLKFLNAEKVICGSADIGPLFGYGPSIQISDRSNQNAGSYSFLGTKTSVYQHPYYAEKEANSFLAGSQRFKVLEIEVFQYDFYA